LPTYVRGSESTNVTDGQTDGQTDDMRSQYRAMHYSASRGKKQQVYSLIRIYADFIEW